MNRKSPKRPITLSRTEIARITAQQKKEFPGDEALQVVHISRKILMREAELMGMDFGEYISYLSKLDKDTQRQLKGPGNRP